MTIGEHIEQFGGLKVYQYTPDDGISAPQEHAYRLGLDWDAFDSGETFIDRFAAFVADPACTEVQSLIIGDWGGAGQGEGSAPVVEGLVSARERLPKLRALFIGEMTVDESEISWITQSDVSPLFEAFPNLEELWLRGGNGLSIGRPRHAKLRKLVIETGGMPTSLVREVASAELPQLEHLELWLGDDGYGNDVSNHDLKSLLTANRFPNLKYLGLRDDCNADETAKLLAAVGIPTTVKHLDLSLGTLGDDGARALADSEWVGSLAKLDIHHHYVSPQVVGQLKKAIAEVDDRDPREPDDWGDGDLHRYVAVSE
jgi:hypothetical protein